MFYLLKNEDFDTIEIYEIDTTFNAANHPPEHVNVLKRLVDNPKDSFFRASMSFVLNTYIAKSEKIEELEELAVMIALEV